MLEALENPPSLKDQLFWTDFIELRTLIHPDKCFSIGDLSSLEKRLRDTNASTRFSTEEQWTDMIAFAGIRSNDFGDSYPFQVSDDKHSLELSTPSDEFNDQQKLYTNLLFSSLMRHFPRNHTSTIGRYFEEVSYEVFKKLMPEGSETRPTWASGGEEAPYTGTLFNKMTHIARDIRCRPNFDENDFKPTDTGDGGIDMISWHPMEDDRPSIPIAFAQCGCSKSDWKFKQIEASPARLQRQLPIFHPWATYYFLPIDLRRPDGDWAYKSDIGAAIIVDRLRLLKLAEKYNLTATLPVLEISQDVFDQNYS